jgi:hypothetical protein
MQRFYVKKLSNAAVNEQYPVKIPSMSAASENLDDNGGHE